MDPRRAGASTVELGSAPRAQPVCSRSTPLRVHGLRCCVSPGQLSWPLARPAWMTARCASRGPDVTRVTLIERDPLIIELLRQSTDFEAWRGIEKLRVEI